MNPYPNAGKDAQPEVQAAIARYLASPQDQGIPLLYWLIGQSTGPLKMPKRQAGYVSPSPYSQACGNCIHSWASVKHPELHICDLVAGVIKSRDYCRLWEA